MWLFLALASASPLSDERARALAGAVQSADLVFTARVEGCRPLQHHLPGGVVSVIHCRLVVEEALLGVVESGRVELALGHRWGGLPLDTELLVFAHTLPVTSVVWTGRRPSSEHLPVFSDVVGLAHTHTALRRADGVPAPLWAEVNWVVGRRWTPWPELGWGAMSWSSLLRDVRSQARGGVGAQLPGVPADAREVVHEELRDIRLGATLIP